MNEYVNVWIREHLLVYDNVYKMYMLSDLCH